MDTMRMVSGDEFGKTVCEILHLPHSTVNRLEIVAEASQPVMVYVHYILPEESGAEIVKALKLYAPQEA